MDWMDQLGGLVKRYAGGQAAQPAIDSDDALHQVLHAVPPSALADGLSTAFRSDQTPPFPQMVAHLFGNSNGEQRAGVLNTLISAAGPTLISELGSRGGNQSWLSGLLGGGQSIAPEQAEQISPDAVQELAMQVEKHDPSIIDQISGFYSAHPTLVKSIGVAAIGLVISRLTSHE